MTGREQRRAQLLTRVLEGAITLREAALVMDISLRQARRLKGALVRAGPAGLTHGNRGRRSVRQTDPAVREAVVAHYRETYRECNVQHFSELLEEREGISLSVETVRRILKAAGLVAPKRRRVKHRSRRERMAAEGMLLQIDASPFRWLGPEGPKWSLVGAIDDATSDPVAAVFRDQEDAAGYMELLREVVTTRGIPAAVYRDRHMIFEVSKRVRSTMEEDFEGVRFPTQVGRLLAELGIESIPAYSPQAKGRVERSWRTQQGRLTAELRLAGVTTMQEANAFLPGYLARYRAHFAIAPWSDQSAYVPIEVGTDLDRLFCFKYQRRVASDNTIQFGGRIIQIPPGTNRPSYARTIVDVHERLDKAIAVFYQGRELLRLPPGEAAGPLRARDARSQSERPLGSALPPSGTNPAPTDALTPSYPEPSWSHSTQPKWKPPANHPWRLG